MTAIAAVTKQWLHLTARDKRFAFTATMIPINYLILFLIIVINGYANPTALVVQDNGHYARAFVGSLRLADTYRLQHKTSAQAERALRAGSVVAVITIPRRFDREVATRKTASVGLQLDNQENDYAEDIRRGLNVAENAFTSELSGGRGQAVRLVEHDDNPRQARYLPYVLVSVLVVAIMIGGLFYGSINAAREYEQRSIVDILMAPRSRFALLLGMVSATFLVAVPGVALVLTLVVTVFGISPFSWPELVVASIVTLALYAACGVLLGTIVRQRNGLSAIAVLIAIPALSISGAFYPATFSSAVIATLAKLTPTYYAGGLLHHAFNAVRTTPTSVQQDYLVLGGMFATAVAAGTIIMRLRAEPA